MELLRSSSLYYSFRDEIRPLRNSGGSLLLSPDADIAVVLGVSSESLMHCALRVAVKSVHNEDNRAGTLFVPIEVHLICLRFLSVTGDHGIMGKTSAVMALLSLYELHGPDPSLSACLYVKCCGVQC